MRPSLNLRFGNGKNLISTSYNNYESIDVLSKYPTFNKILSTNDVKLIDISNLQVDTEKIMCLLGNRMLNLSAAVEGKALVLLNGVSPENNNKSSSNSSNQPNMSASSIDQQYGNISLSNYHQSLDKPSDLILKSSPEKPLAFIISQNRPSTRRTSSIVNKRKSTKPDVNLSSSSEAKRKKPNDYLSSGASDRSKSGGCAVPQNYEIPNKFWELMEPYCAEINEENIRTLESMIRAYENDSVYYEVPELVADSRDSRENQGTLRRNSSEDGSHLNGFVEGRNGVDLSNLLKKIDVEIRKPLTESRALKDFPLKFVDTLSKETEDFIKSHQSKLKETKVNMSNGFSKMIQSSKSMAKQLKVSNSFKLERHIKKTVDDLGICNFNLPFIPKSKTDQDYLQDESEPLGIAKSSEADIIDPVILNSAVGDYVELSLPQPSGLRKRKFDCQIREDKALLGLNRRQAELKLVSESNLGMLRRLMVAAKRDTKRQEIERRLAVADADVIECYNIIESYRPTHKIPLKKDRDAAYKALKERKKILKELDNLDTEFL